MRICSEENSTFTYIYNEENTEIVIFLKISTYKYSIKKVKGNIKIIS